MLGALEARPATATGPSRANEAIRAYNRKASGRMSARMRNRERGETAKKATGTPLPWHGMAAARSATAPAGMFAEPGEMGSGRASPAMQAGDPMLDVATERLYDTWDYAGKGSVPLDQVLLLLQASGMSGSMWVDWLNSQPLGPMGKIGKADFCELAKAIASVACPQSPAIAVALLTRRLANCLTAGSFEDLKEAFGSDQKLIGPLAVLFVISDKNSNDRVDWDELSASLAAVGIDVTREKMIEHDIDGDLGLDRGEFCNLILDLVNEDVPDLRESRLLLLTHQMRVANVLGEIFDIWDKDGDGIIDVVEIRDAMGDIEGTQLAKFVEEIEREGGAVNKRDFILLMRHAYMTLSATDAELCTLLLGKRVKEVRVSVAKGVTTGGWNLMDELRKAGVSLT